MQALRPDGACGPAARTHDRQSSGRTGIVRQPACPPLTAQGNRSVPKPCAPCALLWRLANRPRSTTCWSSCSSITCQDRTNGQKPSACALSKVTNVRHIKPKSHRQLSFVSLHSLRNSAMPDSRFLQIHTLTSFSGVLLNRDETGAAKRMPYGGAVRTRISSQCLKRHWRTAADEWSFEEEADKSLRTRHIFEKQLHQAVKRHTNAPDEIVEAVGKAVTVMLYGREPVKERQAMLFGRPKYKQLNNCRFLLYKTLSPQAQTPRPLASAQRSASRNKKKSVLDERSGRQCARRPDRRFVRTHGHIHPAANTDAAIHVAHAFTVHREESEGDYFTVVDDLSVAEGETGSGGIFDTEITSGLFYSYVVIDVPLLISNLTGVEAAAAMPKAWTVRSRHGLSSIWFTSLRPCRPAPKKDRRRPTPMPA